MREDQQRAGHVGAEEAKEILSRFIAQYELLAAFAENVAAGRYGTAAIGRTACEQARAVIVSVEGGGT